MRKTSIILVFLTFFITFDFVHAATETIKIYPVHDGHIELYEADGISSWEQARNFEGLVVRDPFQAGDAVITRSDKHAGVYGIYRASMVFDTSVLPESIEIDSASLNFYKWTENNEGNIRAYLTSHDRIDYSVLYKEDWNISKYSLEKFTSPFLLNDDVYTVVELNSNGINHINPESYTIFGALTEFDIDDIVPTIPQTGVAWYSVDYFDQNKRPYLEVTYEVPDEPKSLVELLAELIEKIEAGDFDKNEQSAYLAHVKKIEAFFFNGQLNAAENQIKQFMAKVRLDIIKGDIELAEGEELLAIAEQILEIINDTFGDTHMTGVPLITQIASPYSPGADDWEHDLLGSGKPDWCGNTIGRCGCAITSLSMVGRGFGINRGVDGTEVNPRNLNNWLRENNGYDAADGIMWKTALQYFAKPNGKSNISAQTEYEHDNTVIEDFLGADRLAIGFEERVGHFFALTDVLEGGGFVVRDPLWYETKTTNDLKDIANHIQNYGGDVTKAKLFSREIEPKLLSSGIELHLASPAELLVTDSQGRRTGYDPQTGSVVTEIPNSAYEQDEVVLSNDNPSGDIHYVKVLAVDQLEDDLYTLQIVGTGEGEYHLTTMTTGGGLSRETENVTASTSMNQIDYYLIDVADLQQVSHAAARLRALADQKEVDAPSVAERLRENAHRLESKNISATDAEITSSLFSL